MQCPDCGSTDVTIQMVEKGQMTSKKGLGFGGHMNNAARATTAVATLGMSNLFWKKSKGTNKTKTVQEKVAICQNCGNSWVVKGNKLGSAPSSIFK
jgi:transcription elongation factor Elf1